MGRRPVLAVTLCADDYGIAPGVGAAIRDLAERGRLLATGCMVGGPHWADEAPPWPATSMANTPHASSFENTCALMPWPTSLPITGTGSC